MSAAIAVLPETNIQVLEHLRAFRFLTVPQLLRLGVVGHKNSLWRALRRFTALQKPWIGATEFGVLPGIGRLPRVHYLTRAGAEVLAEALQEPIETVVYPKGKVLFSRDYFHRTALIDFQIEFELFAGRFGVEAEFFRRYIDSEGANRSPRPEDRHRQLSKLPLGSGHFIPDGLFACQAPDGSRYLFLIEVFNGCDTKRVHRQLLAHLVALGEGRVSELCGHEAAHRVLCLFASDNALLAAAKRLQSDEAFTPSMRRQFAFSTLERVRTDFAGGWVFFEEGRRTIFDR